MSRRASRLLLSVAVALVAAVPVEVWACPVCFNPKSQARVAFLLTTVFLSLLPLALIAGVVLWIRKAARQAAAEQGAERLEERHLPRSTAQ